MPTFEKGPRQTNRDALQWPHSHRVVQNKIATVAVPDIIRHRFHEVTNPYKIIILSIQFCRYLRDIYCR